MNGTSRRSNLIGSLAAPIAMATSAVQEYPAILPVFPATAAELQLYYKFLWSEFCALADEMGFEHFEGWIMHRAGGHKAAAQRFTGKRPSERASAVLAAAGAA